MHKDVKEILYTSEQITEKCKELAERINEDYQGKDLMLIGLLKGSVPFLAELSKYITLDVVFDYMDVSNKANHICLSNETSNVGLKTSIPELKRAHLSSMFNNRSMTLQQEPEVSKTPLGVAGQKASNDVEQNTLNKRCSKVKNKLSDTCSSARMKNIEPLGNLNSNKRRIAFLKPSNSFINNNLPEVIRSNFVHTQTIASAGRLDSNNNAITGEQSGIVSKVKLAQLKIKKKLFDFTISIEHHFITITLVIIALFSNDLKILCLSLP